MENKNVLSECIVLAGGLGTRLQAAVPGVPKCLAPVGSKPFLYYLLHMLQQQGVQRFIFALGHLHEEVIRFVQQSFHTLTATFVVETEPLGTGGAIQLCLPHAHRADVLIVNGDTLFTGNLNGLAQFHEMKKADCSFAVTFMNQADRYGAVLWDEEGRVHGFAEKGHTASAYINAGVYILAVDPFLKMHFPRVFSFEQDYLQTFASQKNIYALPLQGYFIDIGVPDDYRRAQTEIIQEAGILV